MTCLGVDFKQFLRVQSSILCWYSCWEPKHFYSQFLHINHFSNNKQHVILKQVVEFWDILCLLRTSSRVPLQSSLIVVIYQPSRFCAKCHENRKTFGYQFKFHPFLGVSCSHKMICLTKFNLPQNECRKYNVIGWYKCFINFWFWFFLSRGWEFSIQTINNNFWED